MLALARHCLLRDMLALAKQFYLETLPPTIANGIPVDMDFVGFHATILDFPMTINPNKLHGLITHYTNLSRKVDSQ
jgi:hypothetical protein